MLTPRLRLVAAVAVATLFGVALYLGSTVGMQALRSSEPAASRTPGTVPEFVRRAPETIPTTDGYGPVGPVSLVFAGTDVLSGLLDRMENPWIAVSSRTGDYRALAVPHRPEPGPDAVVVSADGTTLAWGFGDGVVVYDAVEDAARELRDAVGPDPWVGPFSPDGSRLAVYDGDLQVVGVESGEVLRTLTGVDERAARQAVWTPDGTALTYVSQGQLVTHAWASDTAAAVRTPIAEGATLAWQPSGNQLAALRETRGVKTVEVFDVAEEGRLVPAYTVSPDGFAIQGLLGFTNDTRVAVYALRLETGPLLEVYTMSTVDTSPPTRVMQLPGEGENWVGPQTLQVAAEPLSHGSTPFREPRWPWRDLSKLVSSAVIAAFALGLYLTRPAPRRLRRG